LRRLIFGADSLAFLSPLGPQGREWRAATHGQDVLMALRACEETGLKRFVYLSTVAEAQGKRVNCLHEAADVEKLVLGGKNRSYVLRAAPIASPLGGIMAQARVRAARSSPFMLVWGYGETLLQPLASGDLAACVAKCIGDDAPRPGSYTLGGPARLTQLALLDEALAAQRRLKVKFHIPTFLLLLAAFLCRRGGRCADFRERVLLHGACFTVEQNDAAALLGRPPKPPVFEKGA
jgi:uncharacterized protein YbjT (DUF2867 family)